MRRFQGLRVLLRLVLVAAVGPILMSQPVAAQPGPPIIRSIVPDTAAAGLGQMITIQGSDVFVMGSTTVTFTPRDGGDPSSCVFLFAPPSNINEIYVRLGFFVVISPAPPGCDIVPFGLPTGKYGVRVTTSVGTSNELNFQVKEKPAGPVPRRLISPFEFGQPTITTAQAGTTIGILAYGIDTSRAVAVFSQGSNQFFTRALGGTTGPNFGIASLITVPLGLSPGPALVQVRTRVNGVRSEFSFALKLTIVP